MSWLRSGNYLLSAVLCSACDRAPRLQVLGDSTRLAESEASPKTSAIFDGKVVHLRAARGETLGLSARLQADSLRPVRLLLPPEAAVVTGFAVHALEVSEPSSAMYGKSRGTGSYPDVLEPAKGSEPRGKLTYFDVAVPRGTSPGQYRGRLLVGEQEIPVTLEVSSATIDLTSNPLVWVFYLPAEIARAHGLPDVDTPELIEKEREYHALFRAHGAFLAADLPPARFGARRRFVHDVKYWPVAIDISSDGAIERDVHSWLGLFRGTGVTPFAIPIDEPRGAADRERTRHVADVIGRAGGGRPGLLRAVTDAWSPIYGDALDVYLSPRCFPKQALARAGLGERFWTYNGRSPSAGSMILDTDGVALRTWGWIAERYQIELWHAWEGLYFTDRYNRGGPTDVLRDPLTFDERSGGGSDFGNGDGLLAYPGPAPSLRLKALRRGLQDRLLLRELARCGGGETANRIVRRMVPTALGDATGEPSWSLEEPVWERARYEVLDAIERECHGQAVLAH